MNVGGLVSRDLGFAQMVAGAFPASDQGLPRTPWSNSVGLAGRWRGVVLLKGMLQF